MWKITVACLLGIFMFVARDAFAVEVGTAEQCAALNGTWKIHLRSSWQHSCWIDTSSQQCADEGGFSYPRGCQLPMSEQHISDQCALAGGFWGKHGAKMDWCFIEKDKAACLGEGGSWERMGFLQKSGCIRTSRDAGKSCTSSSQCEFRCLAASFPNSANDPVVGVCATTDSNFGCRAFIENGRFVQGPCVD